MLSINTEGVPHVEGSNEVFSGIHIEAIYSNFRGYTNIIPFTSHI